MSTITGSPGSGPPGADVGFRLLGRVEAEAGGRPIRLGAPMDRLVLSALLLAQGRTLTAAELSHRLWGGAGPMSEPGLLRDYLKKVRRHLENGVPGSGQALLPRFDGGYRAVVHRSRVDVHRFDDGVTEARTFAGRDDARAVPLFRGALAEWRADASDPWGVEALAGLPGTWADSQRAALRDRRAAAFTECAAAELRLGGREQRLISELTLLLGAGRPDERVAELLVLACVQAGRWDEARDVIEQTHRRLEKEVGAGLGARLERLRPRVLKKDPALIPRRPHEPLSISPGADMPDEADHDDRRGDLRDLAGRAACLVAETSRRAPAGSGTPEGEEGPGGDVLVGRLRSHFENDTAGEGALAWVGREPGNTAAVAALTEVLLRALLRDRSFAEDVRRLTGPPPGPADGDTWSINATTIGKSTVFNKAVQVSGDFNIH
ncbi:hypothetical protein AGRA3207_003193 [Actinomadura graeca]|uniref:Uncharacterized protein n=1 Tax=Actinomadura graeca TaxID=2750812 RepID=A0ABX8QV30_9ACTN|nr:bacterial transcriptional activator domain-containing protein [Actinomadura graeca]QXJ22226.1 hypothetical protein AGRA3207_003193 [Actinomadura graeca]